MKILFTKRGIAPPTFVCETNQYLTNRDQLLNGGHSWKLPLPAGRHLRGGHEYEFYRTVRADDRLTVTWRIDNIEERTASSGLPLLIVKSIASYRNQDGELLATNIETFIFQSLGG